MWSELSPDFAPKKPILLDIIEEYLYNIMTHWWRTAFEKRSLQIHPDE
jgi:hypothetical protein